MLVARRAASDDVRNPLCVGNDKQELKSQSISPKQKHQWSLINSLYLTIKKKQH